MELNEDKAIIQVFEGTENMSLDNTHTRLMDVRWRLLYHRKCLEEPFNGIGQPIDDMGPLISEDKRDVNGLPLNPVRRVSKKLYPDRNFSH